MVLDKDYGKELLKLRVVDAVVMGLTSFSLEGERLQ